MVRPHEPSNNSSKWMSYLSENVLLDVEDPNAAAPFFWQGGEQVECSAEVNNGKPESEDQEDRDVAGLKKRCREECAKDPAGKANREKMRRDRLNDRFTELSSALDPDRPPKTDKATILCDAVRVIAQLRAESQQLKEGNSLLKDQIKELKCEKNELRDEKARLKTEKEKLEQQVKAMSVPQGYMPHPAAMQAAAAAFAAQAQSALVANKAAAGAVPSYPGMPPMWHWMPPNSVDTSQDHIRHPPVA